MDWNSYRNYEMYFAIPGTGSVMLLMNLRLAPTDLAYVVNHAETKLVVVDETLIPLVEAAAPQFKTVQGYVVFTDKNIKDIQTKLSPVYSYEDLLREADAEYEWPHMDERAACAACYTTGTTGRPKGVYYSHRSTYLHALAIAQQCTAFEPGLLLPAGPALSRHGMGRTLFRDPGGCQVRAAGHVQPEPAG